MAEQKKKTAGGAAEMLAQADLATAEAFAPLEDTAAVRAVAAIGKLGDQPPLRALCAVAIAGGLLAGDARLARAGVRALAAHTAATIVKDFIKRRIDRTRPFAAVRGKGSHKPKPGRDQSKEETSFPSGHSAGAAAVAAAFARDYPEHKAAALAAGGLLSLAQIPRCSHYPTDVGGGIALGIAAEALTSRFVRR